VHLLSGLPVPHQELQALCGKYAYGIAINEKTTAGYGIENLSPIQGIDSPLYGQILRLLWNTQQTVVIG